MSDPTPAEIVRISDQFTADLDRHWIAAARQMNRSYAATIDRLTEDLTAVERLIAARREATGSVPVSWLHRQDRYRRMLVSVGTEFDRYGRLTGEVMTLGQRVAVQRAAQHVEGVVRAALPDSALSGFVRFDPEALQRLAGAFGETGPLDRILASFGPTARGLVEGEIATGITEGLHPSVITRRLLDRLPALQARAQTIVRTEMYRSFREANRAVMRANADVIDGWIWNAHLGRLTCAACLGMHGSVHPIDEPMGSHPNCRCTQLPHTKSPAELGFDGVPDSAITPADLGSADQWLRDQDEATQRRILRAHFGAWSRGDVRLVDTVRTVHTDVWGTTRTVGSRDLALRQAQERRAARRRAIAERAASDPYAGLSPYAAAARRRIDAGIAGEADLRAIGRELRDEIERRAQAFTIQPQIEAIEAKIDVQRAKLYKLMDERSTIRERFIDAGDFEGYLTDPAYLKTQKQMEAIHKRIATLSEGMNDLDMNPYRQATLDVLREIRPMGSTRSHEYIEGGLTKARGNPTATALRRYKRIMDDTADVFPTEWWEESTDFGPLRLLTDPDVRGYHGRRTLIDDRLMSDIAFAGERRERTVNVHELFHRFEWIRPRIVEFERQFYERRTAGEALAWLGNGYKPTEMTRFDRFLNPYMGKDYGGHAWEVGTMAIESLMSRERAMHWGHVSADADLFEFILGVLAAL